MVTEDDRRYDIGSALPGDGEWRVPAGTNLLLWGPKSAERDGTAMGLLTGDPRRGDRSVVVATDRPVAWITDQYRRWTEGSDPTGLAVIDATGTDDDTDTDLPASQVTALASGDVTGIGVGVTRHTKNLPSNRRVRLGMLSASGLGDSLDARQRFSFLHVVTSRVRTDGYLGVFTADPAEHTTDDRRILRTIFDGVVTFEGGEPTFVDGAVPFEE